MENRKAEKIILEINDLVRNCSEPPEKIKLELKKIILINLVTDLGKIVLHYTRKENQLFPLLEKHGVTGPTQVMWSIHDDIRELLKKVTLELNNGKLAEILPVLTDVLEQISSMIYKEENILFPLSIETLTDSDWQKVRYGEEEIGFAWIEPPEPIGAPEERKAGSIPASSLELNTGVMSLEQVNLMLINLPVDISFVDENDTLIYYSDCPDRIFPRTPAVTGRAVQNCHPPDSVDIVNRILKAFRKGRKKTAQFWIQMGDKFIHIRYFAIFDNKGSYRRCLEVSQDVAGIKNLEGQQRLLDWD